MSLTRTLTTTVAAIALTLSLSACGVGEDDEAAAAISDGIVAQSSNDDGLNLDQKQADCVGEGWVTDIGVENLQEYGVITEDLAADVGLNEVEMSEEDGASAASVLNGCNDLTDLLLTSLGDELGGEEVNACITEAVTEDDIEGIFAQVFAGEEAPEDNKVAAAVQQCLAAG